MPSGSASSGSRVTGEFQGDVVDIQPLVEGYAVIVASLAGSFINLAADRLPRGESIVTPRSHCRSCGRVLDAIDLTPVVGYLVRGGRCASCRVPIGITSPVVEIACAAVMAAAVFQLTPWPGVLVGAAAIALIGVVTTSAARRRLVRSGWKGTLETPEAE